MPRPKSGNSLKTPARAALAMAVGVSLAVAAPATAQDAAESAADEYARLLQQISDLEVGIARDEVLLASQERQIDTLRTQIEQVPTIAAALPAVLNRFQAGLEQAIEADPPFQLGERYERLGRMQELIASPDAKLAEKVSRAFQVANIETNYGFELASYAGEHPTDPRRRFQACEADLESDACALTDELREALDGGASLPQLDTDILDGDYVRYGRLSLAYVDIGSDEVLVYTPVATDEGSNWRRARGTEVSDIRRNLRVARGEAAPDMVQAPVIKN